MSQHAEAFAIVKRVGLTVRSSYIAQELNCTAANVQELLLPYVVRRELVACDVQIGGEHLKDYRLAVASGGDAPQLFTTGGRQAEPKVPAFALGKDEIKPTAAPAARPLPPKEETPMSSTSDKIEAAFRKYGPMTTTQLRERVKEDHVATITSQCARAGRFAVLGGGPKSRIYGMPDQEAPKAVPEADKPPRSIHKSFGKGSGRKPTKAKKKRAAAMARAAAAVAKADAARRAAAGAFRPAIAHDGALLLTGAETPGELNAAELRVLVGFIERIDRAGARG